MIVGCWLSIGGYIDAYASTYPAGRERFQGTEATTFLPAEYNKQRNEQPSTNAKSATLDTSGWKQIMLG
ncbi:MAG: hypothetical protein ACR9NN_24035 [Nostochopsis sp.]